MTRDARALIGIKRSGDAVSPEDLRQLIADYTSGEVGDGPMASFLMACVWRGMDRAETIAMTQAFVSSGETVDLGDVGRPVVDKHSTGGVADGVSLVFAPLAAALGLACVKISGRGLGHTGGTIDKLAAIPGFRSDLDGETLRRQAREVGCAIAGQSPALVPADGAIYALRDETGTVASIPLIAASVMAKKLVIGSDLILLDVKVGSGAFMGSVAEARELAWECLEIAAGFGRHARAAITDMSQPLGTAIGNALEVREAVAVLRGERPGRLRDLSVELAGTALSVLTAASSEDAHARAERALSDGTALEAFRAMVLAQGGDGAVVDDPGGVLPVAPMQMPIVADRSGTIAEADAAEIGAVAHRLGAGRHGKGEPIDPAVGIVLEPKVGDAVEAGERVGTVHARTEAAAAEAVAGVLGSIAIVPDAVAPPPLVHAWIEEVG